MTDDKPGSDLWKQSSLSEHKVPRRSPWCPGEEDGRLLLEAAAPALGATDDPMLLVLGVTPEVIALGWPAPVRTVTVDSSAGMIASSWRPNPSVRSDVVCAWWQQMPLADASAAAAVGDGSLNALRSLDEFAPVLDQVARVLRPGGVLALRCFLRPERQERPEELLERAMRREFPTMSGFRFRLAMALAGGDGSMALGQVPEALSALAPDRDALAEATGWPRQDIDSTDAGAGSPIRITFPTEAELMRRIESFFEVRAMRRGSYTQAQHCPTVVLSQR